MKEFWRLGTVLGLIAFAGFWSGKNFQEPTSCQQFQIASETIAESEDTTLRFLSRKDDLLTLSLAGPGRIIVDQHLIFEEEGEHTFSWAQIPTDSDLELRTFPYLGNTKTQKFYETDSYPARGTEVRYRRFFYTIEEAKAAGFIPAKNLQ